MSCSVLGTEDGERRKAWPWCHGDQLREMQMRRVPGEGQPVPQRKRHLPTCAAWLQVTAEVHVSLVVGAQVVPREEPRGLAWLIKPPGGRCMFKSSVGEGLVRSTCRFPWCKCSQHGPCSPARRGNGTNGTPRLDGRRDAGSRDCGRREVQTQEGRVQIRPTSQLEGSRAERRPSPSLSPGCCPGPPPLPGPDPPPARLSPAVPMLVSARTPSQTHPGYCFTWTHRIGPHPR